MKKLTTILIAFVALFSASAFAANSDKVTEKVKQEFEKNFSTASYASWKKTEGIYFVTFKVNEQDLSAAYNEEGELLGASRMITLSQLPLSVSLTIQNNYSKYSFDPSVTEITKDAGTTYYLTAVNNKYKLSLMSDSNGNMNVIKKAKNK